MGDLGNMDPCGRTRARYTLILLRRDRKTPEENWEPGAHMKAPLLALFKSVLVRARLDIST